MANIVFYVMLYFKVDIFYTRPVRDFENLPVIAVDKADELRVCF